MGEGPGPIIEYARPVSRGRDLGRRSVPFGVAAAVGGAVAWGVVWFCPIHPFIDVGIFGFLTAPVFGLVAFVYAVRGIVAERRVGRAGITLLLVALSLTAWCCAFLVIVDGERRHYLLG